MSSMAYGIDLGTTFCCVSRVGEGGEAEIIRNSEGQQVTPSVVLITEEATFVGQMAKAQRAMYAADTIEFVKHQMGNPAWRFPAADGTEHTAESVSSIILKKLVDDANDVLGLEVNDIVVTVPAYFDDTRRAATKQAAAMAGLNVLEIINEPTAAALSFGLSSGFEGSLLVYDLGGGTFDATLVDVHDGVFDVVGTDGDRNLGGRNWDDALIQHLRAEFRERTGTDIGAAAEDEAMLRDRAEAVKLSLTQAQKASAFISYGGCNERIVVTREEFEKMTEDLLIRTKWLIDEVLETAGRDMSQVDKLLLVGGSTRMPMVPAMIEENWGIAPDKSVHPDEAVALGAGIHAANLQRTAGGGDGSADQGNIPEFVIHDVTSHGMGVVALNEAGVEANTVLIPAQTKIPAHAHDVFGTVADNQTQVNVRVTVGDDTELEYVSIIGESMIDLPPMPKGSPVKITFHYDVDGIVHVEVHDGTSGKNLGEFPVVREGALTESELTQFKQIVKGMEIQ